MISWAFELGLGHWDLPEGVKLDLWTVFLEPGQWSWRARLGLGQYVWIFEDDIL